MFMMFEGFEKARITTSEAEINLVHAGKGPPLLLLHGYPQTHVIWHKIAPRLAADFHVVVPDLRGYGDSSKPSGGADHAGYSKRAMAKDQFEVMQALGYPRFFVAGHDRGGRVAHRMALDHPERVLRAAVLDIVPTHKLYSDTKRAFATAYYHWFFLIQPFDFPETLIGNNVEYYLRRAFGRWGSSAETITPEAFAEYLRCFRDPAAIHATCEDYRAAASIDLEHDEADLGRKLGCPLLVLWGRRGAMHKMYDVLATWRERAGDIRGWPLDCGHYLPEEAPDETEGALRQFFSG
jgi:haloacetate dehalogenase